MEYSDLEPKAKYFINGKISQYMDAYIRQHKVWTPEQMHSDFIESVNEQIDNKSFTEYYEGKKITWSSELAMNWLITSEGEKLVMDRFKKKYSKDKPIADRKSPLAERIRFGTYWNTGCDINFGLKDGSNFIATNELKKLVIIPWSIEHVNMQLSEKYNFDLKHCLGQLSTSFLEKKFSDYWLKHYYGNISNAALIPEVCGLRAKFYYYTHNDQNYTSRREIPSQDVFSDVKAVNFRFDFLIINYKKQKIVFIELDGFEFHKTREQQTIDSIKRNTASNLGIPLLTFTSKRINDDIEAVFSEIHDYLT